MSLFSLRIYCQQRFDVWMQNAGTQRQGKRSLAAAQLDEEESDQEQLAGDRCKCEIYALSECSLFQLKSENCSTNFEILALYN